MAKPGSFRILMITRNGSGVNTLSALPFMNEGAGGLLTPRPSGRVGGALQRGEGLGKGKPTRKEQGRSGPGAVRGLYYSHLGNYRKEMLFNSFGESMEPKLGGAARRRSKSLLFYNWPHQAPSPGPPA